MRSHILQSMWTVSLQRLRPPQHPGRKNQVRIPQRVIRMQMSYKNNLQLFSLKRRDPIRFRRRSAPHHTRPTVDQVGPIIHHHRHRWPPPLRISPGIPRPQHHHVSRGCLTIFSESASANSNRHPNQQNKIPPQSILHGFSLCSSASPVVKILKSKRGLISGSNELPTKPRLLAAQTTPNPATRYTTDT